MGGANFTFCRHALKQELDALSTACHVFILFKSYIKHFLLPLWPITIPIDSHFPIFFSLLLSISICCRKMSKFWTLATQLHTLSGLVWIKLNFSFNFNKTKRLGNFGCGVLWLISFLFLMILVGLFWCCCILCKFISLSFLRLMLV